MADLCLNQKPKTALSLRETEKGIKFIKDAFQNSLAQQLCLQRISAPLFVKTGSGINDDLNGIENKAAFHIKAANTHAEVVFSLAKWKRMVLADYGFQPGEGLYTDMIAIRPDEEALDNIHSAYVDQWDWERIIHPHERNLDFLKNIVRKIYHTLKNTERAVHQIYPHLIPILPDDITFIHTEDLLRQFPNLSPKERENQAAKKYGALFLIGIGGELPDGNIHDGRAPDYDDWTTPTTDGKKGLNGDILLWYPPLNRSFELSSMGIRVDADTMLKQLQLRNALDRKDLYWHQRLLKGQLPLTIGGGIGQCRLCMFLLKKIHIGEVHCSIWPDETIQHCKSNDIRLL